MVSAGLTVYAQVPCAGFFIDFVVLDSEGRRFAVECDGDFHYEDGELREEDYQRQDIIERYGWEVYRIPSRRYYSQPGKTIEDLLRELSLRRPDEEVTIRQHEGAIETDETLRESRTAEDDGFTMADPDADGANNRTVNEGEDQAQSALLTALQQVVMDLLANDGPMPIWKISDRIKQHDKSEIQDQLETMALQGWVECITREGGEDVEGDRLTCAATLPAVRPPSTPKNLVDGHDPVLESRVLRDTAAKREGGHRRLPVALEFA